MVNAQATKQALKNAVMNEDAQGFARVFVLPPIGSSSSSSSSSPQKHQPQSFNIGDSDYGGLLVSLLDAIASAEAGDASSCFEAQVSLHSHFNRLYATSEGNWFVPALMVVCKNTSFHQHRKPVADAVQVRFPGQAAYLLRRPPATIAAVRLLCRAQDLAAGGSAVSGTS